MRNGSGRHGQRIGTRLRHVVYPSGNRSGVSVSHKGPHNNSSSSSHHNSSSSSGSGNNNNTNKMALGNVEATSVYFHDSKMECTYILSRVSEFGVMSVLLETGHSGGSWDPGVVIEFLGRVYGVVNHLSLRSVLVAQK
jgi:predicted acyltransferase (DUF342 family)